MTDVELAKVIANLRTLETARDNGTIKHWSVGTMGLTGQTYGVRVVLRSGLVVQELGRTVREAFERMGGTLEDMARKGAARG